MLQAGKSVSNTRWPRRASSASAVDLPVPDMPDDSAFVEPPAGDADDGQLGQRAGEEATAGAFVEQVLSIEEGPGEAPQDADDPLRTLRQSGHAAGWFAGVAGGGLQLVFGLFCGGQPGGYAGGQLTFEDHPCEKRNPVGGGDVAAFAGDGADGEPGCGGAERRLERDAVSECAREPGCRGGECGATAIRRIHHSTRFDSGRVAQCGEAGVTSPRALSRTASRTGRPAVRGGSSSTPSQRRGLLSTWPTMPAYMPRARDRASSDTTSLLGIGLQFLHLYSGALGSNADFPYPEPGTLPRVEEISCPKAAPAGSRKSLGRAKRTLWPAGGSRRDRKDVVG
jgi:hypothetical protein